MNRAMIFPIHKKWDDKIFDGSKQFEFRNKLPKHLVKGMKIYFYEAKGDRRAKRLWEDYPLYIGFDTYEEPYASYVYEGQGMIVGEATVGEIYEAKDFVLGKLRTPKTEMVCLRNDNNDIRFGKDVLEICGYDYQQYAIELTNVIKYDEEWITDKLCESDMPCAKSYELQKYESMLCKAPSAPIPKEEFVSWNKVLKIKDSHLWQEADLEQDNYSKGHYIDQCKLTHAPQAPIYVVSIDNSIE